MLYVSQNLDAQMSAFLFPAWLCFLVHYFPLSVYLTPIYEYFLQMSLTIGLREQNNNKTCNSV